MTTHLVQIARATHRIGTRRRWAAGMITCSHLLIVGSSLISTGCQGPFRLWRKDEPTIEQLLAAPQPWDAELPSRAGSNLSPQPAGSATRSSATASRSNPSNAQSTGSNYNVSGRDTRLEEMSEEELQTMLADLPPNMRPLAKRQWEASRAHALTQKSQQKNATSGNSSTAGANNGDGDIRLAALERQKEPSRSDAGPAVYKLSDNDESDTAENSLGANGEQPSNQRNVRRTPTTSKNGSDKKLAANSVHQTLRDDQLSHDEMAGESEFAELEAGAVSTRGQTKSSDAMRKMVQNVPPPGVKKSSRQVPHKEAADTGVEDDSLALLAAQSAHQPSDVVLASGVSSRQANDMSVAKAAAESKGPGAMKGQVVPASSNANALPDTKPVEKTLPPPANAYESARLMLRQLQEEGQQSANESPAQQLHRQAFERMLHVYLGELEPALRPIDGLQSHEQEYFRHQFQSLFNATDPKGNPDLARRWALVMENQRHAMTHLGAVSSLEVKNAAFCTNVDGFAAVTKFPTNQFKPGSELLLYCEVDNFVSEQVKDGYETKLQGSYHILDAGGARIADVLLPQEVDICKRPRRDYFFVYRIYLPQTIAPGRYQLQLSIEDMKGRKFGQSTLDFQIAN